MLQSYILSTTTETRLRRPYCRNSFRLQSYILSTTTETVDYLRYKRQLGSFNRTSFQQQLKPKSRPLWNPCAVSFNRTSFQQQLKLRTASKSSHVICFNRTSFQQQLKPCLDSASAVEVALQSYILSTTTETVSEDEKYFNLVELQSYILSTTTETD